MKQSILLYEITGKASIKFNYKESHGNIKNNNRVADIAVSQNAVFICTGIRERRKSEAIGKNKDGTNKFLHH